MAAAYSYAHLLTQSDELKSEIMTRAEECSGPPKETQDEPKHWDSLHRRLVIISRPSNG
jgi:hypothetical protein